MSALSKKSEDPEVLPSGSSLVSYEIKDYWDWAPQGLCIRFMAKKTFELREKISQAKFICSACPVKTDCLIWALLYNEYGIWGGTSRQDRDKLYSRKDRDLLIESAKKQKQFYLQHTPGSLIRQFLERPVQQSEE